MSNKIISALGILAVATACTGLSEVVNPEDYIVKEEVVIRAIHEYDAHTKTVLQEDGSVWWQPNDAIGVFFGKYCSWFRAYNMEDAPSANFIGEAIIIEGHNENSNGNTGEYTYWGVFPPDLYCHYDDDDDFSYWSGNEDYEEPTRERESVNVYLPAKQKGVAGTFDSNNFISIARSKTYKELPFYNLCGGLAFCVEKEGIHTVIFKGNSDEALAGYVNVVMNSEGYPVVNEVRNGKKEVKLTMPEGDYFVPGEWYYIVMLPTALENGYSMTFYTDREMGTVVSSKSVEIKRSVFGRLTNPDSEVEYTEFIPVESVEIRAESYNEGINIGDTLALTAVITPSDCTFPAVWSSSDPSVATVDENGNVVGVSEGEARITLTVGDMSDYRWVYVYGKDNEDEKVPSFAITSIDLTDVYAVSAISIEYDDYGRTTNALQTISHSGVASMLKFEIESDDENFKQFVKDSVVFSADRVWQLTDKYLIINYLDFVYDEDTTPGAYRKALGEIRQIAIRLSDGVVLQSDVDIWWHSFEVGKWDYQRTYYYARESYDGQSIYCIDTHGFYVTREENGRLVQELQYNYEGSQFRPSYDRILLDKDNNILTYEDGVGYVLCNDKSIVPFTFPDLPDEYWEVGTFFEVDYTWYYWSGSNYWDEENYFYRKSARLYKVTLENQEVKFTELTSATYVDDWYYRDSYYRRGNTFIYGYDGSYVVIDMDKVEVSYVSVEQQGYAEHITPDGYYYKMENNVLSKYDLLSGEPTVIPTDRSNVPPMTPTSPEYDETNHCFVESGNRLSDSELITIVTDAETGKVIVYEGKYENSTIYVKLP